MSNQFSMLSIMNAALTARGWDEIVSENDGTQEFRAMARNWPLIVQTELEKGLYNFSREEAVLSSRQPGKFGFEDGYLVPTPALFVRNVWINPDKWREATSWTQDGSAVYVDAEDGCKIEYMICSDERLWSASFCSAMNHAMQAVLISAFEGEPAEAREERAIAKEQFEEARALSSKSRSTSRTVRTGRIAAARFNRGTT